MLEGIKNIHFIGIGGAGMSAIAYVLLKRGFVVSGSDANPGYMATKLAKEGAMIYIGHAACQIEGADAIVTSTAIHGNNPELVEAQARHVPILHRSDVLAELLNAAKGVAIAGAHGKTTTSSMLACICTEGGADPTVVIGGIVSSLEGNARNGASEIVVAEADESDGSFLKFHPYLAVITNIENDHMDHYGSEENIYQAFHTVLEQITAGGKAILCFDNEKLRKLARETSTEVISYGVDNNEVDYSAQKISYDKHGTSYELYHKGQHLTTVRLIVPGRHNVLNSLGALAAALELGIALPQILASLQIFSGAKRRFETKGKLADVWVVDDYAHHPTEIKVTLAAAKQTQPKRLVCVFQPHRYSRTQLLFEEFVHAFGGCDELILTDIYCAGEEKVPGISSEILAQAVAATGQKVTYIAELKKIPAFLAAQAQQGDLIMTIGAGDVYTVGEALVTELKRGK
ncbi:MAG: UDP-N-acetylmuramate--L-alanine ligase [Acidaminococcaceae bacterium]